MSEKIIIIPSAQWNEYKRKLAEKTALELDLKTLKETFNLPAPDATTEGKYVVHNGNGDTVGKYSVSFRKAYEVKETYAGRLS
jgi:hypothetical protein